MAPDLSVPSRLLMGSGPSNPDPRVLRAMATALVGQFDPSFTALMEETQAFLRQVFRTRNRCTYPVSGTSRAGMEAALISLLEPGDRVLAVENGRFGLLFEEIARRTGADVSAVRAPWGAVVEPVDVDRALRSHETAVVTVVHGETSTGAMNPIPEIAAIAHRHGALVVVDAVSTLAGAPLEVDGWDLDVCVGGTQKCLGCPSGLAPITYTDAVAARMGRRSHAIRSNYLDLTQLERYWSSERLNHHTAPTSMIYGLREALRIVLEEGLETRLARHRAAGDAMALGLARLGLTLFGQPVGPTKMPMLTPVCVPEGVVDTRLRARLLEEHGVEIMGAFAELEGRIWRLGTMGHNARCTAVIRALTALSTVLGRSGADLHDALAAANQRFDAPG